MQEDFTVFTDHVIQIKVIGKDENTPPEFFVSVFWNCLQFAFI